LAKKKDLRAGRFVGCPFAGFVYQSASMDADHRKALTTINRGWEVLLGAALERAVERGHLVKTTDPVALARRVLMLYQGGVTAWRLTENRAYIDDMEAAILEELDRHAS